MSQGLGIAQRRLLTALYSAHIQELLRFEITGTGTDTDPLVTGRRRDTVDLGDGSEFYLITQLGLAEYHHPVLAQVPRRSPKDRGIHYTRRDWYSLNPTPSTPAEGDLLRTWRSLYRRAGVGLTTRGYIETARALVDLDDLGQWADPSGGSFEYYHDHPYAGWRKTVLARITEAGRQYVELRRTELAAEPGPAAHDLRRALRASGFLDIDEVPPQPERELPPRRPRLGWVRRKAETPVADSPVEPPDRELHHEDVVDQLTAEGFEPGQARAALRAWHRQEQRIARELYGDNGVPLEQWVFTPDEIDELRQRLPLHDEPDSRANSLD